MNQSGALDESYSDVFGYLLDPDDWLHGEEIKVFTEEPLEGGFWDSGVGDGDRESGDECLDALDNDGDGWINEGCPERDVACDNTIDDDSDGRTNEGCPETGIDCGNLTDDDGDGYIDEGCPGSCSDGIDNSNTGGAIDDADTDCFGRDMSNPPAAGQPDHINVALSGDGQGLRVLAAGDSPICDADDTDYNDCGWVHR
jgi:hypothetical protein